MRRQRLAILALFAALWGQAAAPAVDLAGKQLNPFSVPARARVLIFARSDCPLTNRYAPELRRLAEEFAGQGVRFWLVYAGPAMEPEAGIQQQLAEYKLPGQPLRDVGQQLAKRAKATVAPEAAVFDQKGRLVYHGRIDDRWVAPGKAKAAAGTHDLEYAIADTLAGRRIERAETHAVGCSLADLQ